MSVYDDNSNRADEALRPNLTDDFLATLALAVRTCGHTVDHIESSRFVSWCFELAGKEKPDLAPFDYSA